MDFIHKQHRAIFEIGQIRHDVLGSFEAGPLAICTHTPISRGMQVARLSCPGLEGRRERICPSGSPRFLAASMAICSTSITSRWPTISEIRLGRKTSSCSGWRHRLLVEQSIHEPLHQSPIPGPTVRHVSPAILPVCQPARKSKPARRFL